MTNYPASIDTSQTLFVAVDNLTPVSAAIVNNLRAAIIAIEQTLGVKPAGPYGTVAARLTNDENIVGNLQIISLAGDLGGTLTDPLVVGIQGRPVSSAAPALADVLSWNGIAWIPSAGGGGGGSVIFSQDIVGTNTVQTVVGIQDHPVSSATPSVGETFIWNGTNWAPGNNFGNQSLFTTGEVQTGPLLSTSTTTGFVEVTGKIIANAISTSVVSNSGQGIIYFDSTDNQFLVSQNGGSYIPLVSGAGSAGGDLSGNYPNPLVSSIQSVSVVDGVATVFNVKFFGAVGNGIANDFTACQAALTACGAAGGGTVYFPAGIYNQFTNNLIVSSNTEILGDGYSSQIFSKASFGLWITAVSNVAVRKMQINMEDPTALGRYGISIENGAFNITIEDCYTVNCCQYGILASGDLGQHGEAEGIIIRNNIIDMRGLLESNLTLNTPIGIECFPKGGTGFLASPGIVMEGNTVLATPGTLYAGIKISGQNSPRILNNFVSGVSSSDPEGGIDVLASTGAIISGNRVTQCAYGIVVSGLTTGDNILPATNFIVSNNVIDNFLDSGIIGISGFNGLIIANNNIDAGTAGGAQSIFLGLGTNTVTNAVSGTGGAIQLTTSAANGFTNGQTVFVAGVTGTTEANGYWTITIVNGTNFLLVGSTFVHAYVSGGTVEAVYTDLVVTGNTSKNAPTGFVATVQCPGCVVTGNKINGGILETLGDNSVVSNNVVVAPGFVALNVNGNNVSVSSNTINDCAIGISASGSNINVDANTVSDFSTYGVSSGGGADGLTVTNNSFQPQGGGGLYGTFVGGSSIIISGNRFNGCILGTSAPSANMVVASNSIINSYSILQGDNMIVDGNSILTSTTNLGMEIIGNDALVQGNLIQNTFNQSMFVNGDRARIMYNTFTDANTSATSDGSVLSMGGNNWQIIGNRFQNLTGAGQAYYGIYYDDFTGLMQRDNIFTNLLSSNIFSAFPTGTILAQQDGYADHTTTSCGTDTTEDTLKSTTYNPGSFGLNGGLTIKIAGSASGSGGTKDVRVYFGSLLTNASFTVSSGSMNWMIIGTVFNANNENSQVYEMQFFENGALTAEVTGTGGYNTGSNSVLVKVTGQKVSSSDVCSCNLFITERLQ